VLVLERDVVPRERESVALVTDAGVQFPVGVCAKKLLQSCNQKESREFGFLGENLVYDWESFVVNNELVSPPRVIPARRLNPACRSSDR
jgi:hypothetical protein